MSTQCTPTPLAFHAFGRRQVVGRFDAGRLTSDGGTLLLREVDRRLGPMGRVAGCFTDYRDPARVEHSVLERVTQRVGGIAWATKTSTITMRWRTDSLLALWAGKADLTGARRSRERDRGYALAGSSTLNRLELSRPEAAARDRHHRIAADTDALDRVLVDLFLDAHTEAPEAVWLDLDATGRSAAWRSNGIRLVDFAIRLRIRSWALVIRWFFIPLAGCRCRCSPSSLPLSDRFSGSPLIGPTRTEPLPTPDDLADHTSHGFPEGGGMLE